MPQNGRNNSNNQFVKKSDPQNKSRMVIEPSLDSPQPTPEPSPGRYNDRIKIAPMDEEGRATPRAVKNWPEGVKKA
jgi:hypothetical protein